jgi:large repetitive protein
MSIAISGIPDGAVLSSGTDSITVINGVTIVGQDQLTNLGIQPAADDDSDFSLTMTTTTSEDGTSATSTTTFDVDVTGVADTPTVEVNNSSSMEDTTITLPDITSSLIGTDGSESLGLSISGIPSGATLTSGTDSYSAPNGGGSVDVSDWNLADLEITPPPGSNVDFNLTVTSTSTEADGSDTASTVGTISISVTGAPRNRH